MINTRNKNDIELQSSFISKHTLYTSSKIYSPSNLVTDFGVRC